MLNINYGRLNNPHRRLMITGAGSGCGKTTITCAILSALRQSEKFCVTSFKCGPDYIDTMLHKAALGADFTVQDTEIPHKSYNIDAFFLKGGSLTSQLARGFRKNEPQLLSIAVLEGVMGHYDGIALTTAASSYDVSVKTKTPAILVVNAYGSGASLRAVIHGFVKYAKKRTIQGVIFNNIDEKRYLRLKPFVEESGVRCCGYFPRTDDFFIESRHLGLLTPNEIEDFDKKILQMGKIAAETIDFQMLLNIADTAEMLSASPLRLHSDSVNKKIRLAVSRDEAFCFMYGENIEILKDLNCEIAYFSPAHDKTLPENIDGIYICGGYPELYAEELEKNTTMRYELKNHIENGMPTIAEGGGFVYLHKNLVKKSGKSHEMLGIFGGNAHEKDSLQRFGYITLFAKNDCAICRKGDQINSREFHYFDSDDNGNAFSALRGDRTDYACVHASNSLYAGFPQLYFPSSPAIAVNFVERMRNYAQ